MRVYMTEMINKTIEQPRDYERIVNIRANIMKLGLTTERINELIEEQEHNLTIRKLIM